SGITGADLVEGDDRRVQRRRLRQAERRRRGILDQRHRLEPRQRLQPALRLARLRRLVAKAVDKFLQMRALPQLVPGERGLARGGLAAGAKKLVEPAGIE